VLRWPVLRRPAVLVPLALAAGAAIETLQWALPLGRVVSPVDAVLNAAGAVTVGLVVGGLPGVGVRLHRPPPRVGSRA
jgi:VanZ family protein